MDKGTILNYLGLLENGALNYYQAIETIKTASQSIQNYIEQLEQQVKKQKEAINKIQMIIINMQSELIGIKPYHSYVVDGNIIRNMTKNIEDILNGVSKCKN